MTGNNVGKHVQGQLVFGELVLSMKQEGGKTEQLWKTWILPFVPVLGAGNLSTLEIFRYSFPVVHVNSIMQD